MIYSTDIARVLTISLSLCNAICTLLLAFFVYFYSVRVPKFGNRIVGLFATISICSACDVLIYLVEGNIDTFAIAGAKIAKTISVFGGEILFFFIFWIFVFFIEDAGGKVGKLWTTLVCLHLSIYSILLIFNLFQPILFYFNDQNQYCRIHDTIWIGYGFVISSRVLLIAMLVVSGTMINKGVKRRIWLLVMICAIADVMQLLSPNVPVFNFIITYVFAFANISWQRYHIKQEELREKELLETRGRLKRTKEELDEVTSRMVVSQIKSHFIANTLLSIRILMNTNPQLASKAMEDFEVLSRGVVKALDSSLLISIREELSYTKSYLDIQKMRFGDALHYEIEGICLSEKKEYDKIYFEVPALTVLTIAENAIEHGIRKSETGEGTVWIRICEKESEFQIVIKDDGVGFDSGKVMEEQGLHTGLRNVKKRLEILLNGSMDVESMPYMGTSVLITIPKEMKNDNISG